MVEIKPPTTIIEKGIRQIEQTAKTVLHTKPVQFAEELIAAPNPLVMDAKATLSQINVSKPINEKRYQMFKDILDSKILKFIREQYTQTYKKINPINKSNIDAS
jgi:hypothetical protein